MTLKKILFYALAIVAPGGLVVVAGYHTYKFVKGRIDRNKILTPTTIQPVPNEE